MSDFTKVKPSHTQRAAIVYIRQSTPAQVEYNRESTTRQYALVDEAGQLGWAKDQVIVIDEDLGLTGSGWAKRSGFARMTAEVALGHVGIVLARVGKERPSERNQSQTLRADPSSVNFENTVRMALTTDSSG